jgi:uncharacterized protein with FMN-binding domain
MLSLGRAARKLFVSVFVIFTFVIYAVHERLAGPGQSASANGLPATPQPTTSLDVPATEVPSPTAAPLDQGQDAAPTAQPPATATTPPVDQPTVPVPASPTAAGQYRDGQYTGPQVDAYYGWVQVQAVVQHGQIADVKFLQYPHDRRTSQEINNQAMPWLTTEAIQVQSANVDIIGGATLTSQAFSESLQAALQSATP